ncbi:MAG: DUF1015 family protein [Actinomycetota bacterium]
MPAISGFSAIRYGDGTDLALVTAPPYDVISPDQRERLAAQHPHNMVHLTLGEQYPSDTDQDNRYTRAARTFRNWLGSGVLQTDPEERLFLHRLDFSKAGAPRSIAGVIAALALEPLGSAGVYGHEQTISGPKIDRLNLWRSTRANFEPLWFFAAQSLAGFQDIVDLLGTTPALADMVDPQATRHRVWTIPAPEAEALTEQVAQTPLVVADGHHRYETSLSYRDERRAIDGTGPWDFTLAMITDPVVYAPAVEPIHRIVEGLPWSLIPSPQKFDSTLEELSNHVSAAGAGTVGVATAGGRWTVRSTGEIDTVWLAETIIEPSGCPVTYEHHMHMLSQAMNDSNKTVFLMPATPVDLVARKALQGVRMPPKTTLFTPKPLSGLLMRDLTLPKGG